LVATSIPAAALYGAAGAPKSEEALEALFEQMASQLERFGIVFEFLAIMRSAPILPLPLRPMQHLLVRAAVDLTPRWLRTIVGLNGDGLRAWEQYGERENWQIASSLKLTLPSRLVAACGCRLIICMRERSSVIRMLTIWSTLRAGI
jgi:uncharacterized protein (DUF2236 family)